MRPEQVIIDDLVKSKTTSENCETLKEIESNNVYIRDVQLKKLMSLHDKKFKETAVVPLVRLYEKFNTKFLNEGDLQNWAEIIDRDLRILESTLQIIDEERDTSAYSS